MTSSSPRNLAGVRRHLSAAVVCGLAVVALGAAGALGGGSPTIAQLSRTPTDSARLTVWYVFRASDCGLSDALLQDLNALARSRSVAVRGIMLDPIEDEVEFVRVTEALGIEFDVAGDSENEWRQAAVRERQSNPFMVIYQGNTRLGIITPNSIRAIRMYLPSVLDLGREP